MSQKKSILVALHVETVGEGGDNLGIDEEEIQCIGIGLIGDGLNLVGKEVRAVNLLVPFVRHLKPS